MSDEENDMHIQEDDDSEDDKFEENLQKQYAMFPKKSDKRPESKHGRPESSKFQLEKNTFKNEQTDSFHQQSKLNDLVELDANQISDALIKFDRYVSYHHVQIEEFWKSNKIFALPDDFIQFLHDVGYSAGENEVQDILLDLVNEHDQITIENLCKKVSSWHQNENVIDAMLEFIREKALKLAQDSKSRFSAQSKSRKPQSASASRPYSTKARTTGGEFRPISGITVKSQKSQMTEFKIGAEKPVQNMSKYYLQKAKEKDKEMDRLLQLTINKGKNEFEYEMLIKMGEANELSQLLESKITYRAYKSAQGNLKVHMYDLDKFVKDMTLEEFQREYNMIKNKYNETKNLKCWEVLSENKKNQKTQQHFQKGESAGGNKDELIQEKEGQSKVINKKERQAELKKVLLETMMLTNVLKEQLSVLNRKGINQQYNASGFHQKQTQQI